jgi:hypothetical protein
VVVRVILQILQGVVVAVLAAAMVHGRSSRGGRTPASGHGDNSGRGGRGSVNSEWPQCQVYLKYGHTANKCWYRYDEDYVPEQRHTAAAATTSYTVDMN